MDSQYNTDSNYQKAEWVQSVIFHNFKQQKSFNRLMTMFGKSLAIIQLSFTDTAEA